MADEKVINIFGGPRAGEADAEVVALVETLLEAAKSGDLVGFAYTAVRKNSGFSLGFCGQDMTMLGAMDHLRFVMNCRVAEAMEE